ncbi:MAG: hypothetical protein ABSF54_16930 [Bryobacteraceae bacterium]|jgi:hypothetical protein
MSVNLRAAIALGCMTGFSLTVFGSRAIAGDNTTTYTPVAEGSTLTHRPEIDSWYGQVYIYVGGSLPVGTNVNGFQYLFDMAQQGGTTTGYITPLLFEFKPGEAYTIFTVVGIGEGFDVALNSLAQSIPFNKVEGTSVATGPNFTFGFINALVDSNGAPTATSLGAVDMVSPANGGEGVGGARTTNDWAASDSQSPTPVVALGTTFGAPGANTDYIFFAPPYRTYSARAIGAVPAQ